MYNLEWKENAFRELNKLEKNHQLRIISVLERIRTNPFDYAKKLKGTQYFRFRIGSYRIIADIQKNKMIILVIDIGHRKKVYLKFKKKVV